MSNAHVHAHAHAHANVEAPPMFEPTALPARAFDSGGLSATTAPSPAPDDVFEGLARAPRAFVERLTCADGQKTLVLTRSMLVMMLVASGAFGAAIGVYRGGIQILYCATKMPLLLLATLALCAPGFAAITKVFRISLNARQSTVLALAACTRLALVLACIAPVMLLARGWLGYHHTILLIVGACALAGSTGAALLVRGLSRADGPGHAARVFFGASACALLFGVVGAHTSWILRPFLVRPQTTLVPFVRSIEGSWFDSVRKSSRSSAGVYE